MAKQITTAEENLIIEMHGMLNNLCGKFTSHTENKTIHTQPPCDAHKTLSGRLWGLGVATLAALIGVAYNALKG
jgi:hypothetical protein